MGAAAHKFKPAAYKIAVAAYNINLQNTKSDYNTKKREHSFSILKTFLSDTRQRMKRGTTTEKKEPQKNRQMLLNIENEVRRNTVSPRIRQTPGVGAYLY